MQYSWSVNLNLKSNDEVSDPVWALAECEVYPVMNGQLYVYARNSGKGALIADSAFKIISQCKIFETNSTHINNLIASNPQLKGMQLELNNMIDSLRKAGILVEAESVLKRINTPSLDVSPPPAVKDVFIATCDRPEGIRRLLATAASDVSLKGGGWKYNVLDDSRDPLCSHQTQALVERLKLNEELDVQYVGVESLRAIELHVSKKNPKLSDPVNYLMWGDRSTKMGTYGAAWNRALLLSVGRGFIKVDDDALLKICVSGKGSRDVCIGKSHRKPQFLNGGEWGDYLENGQRSVLNEHAKFLGQPLGEALNVMGGSSVGVSALVHQPVNLFNSVNANSKILITACGYIGDPGTVSNHWLFGLPKDERDVFVRSEGEYVSHKRVRNLLLGQDCFAFNTHSDLMSAVTGIHNAVLLPPYFPLLRNEDFLFGKMTHFLFPECLVMDQPWMVPHLPLESRQWAHDEITKPRKMGTLFFIGMYIEKRQREWSGASLSARYTALTEVLKDLYRTEDAALLSLVHDEMSALAASTIYNDNETLKEFPDAPSYWKADLQGSIESNMRLLAELDSEFLVDLKFAGTREKAIEVFRQLLFRYIQAFELWPEIRESMIDFSLISAERI